MAISKPVTGLQNTPSKGISKGGKIALWIFGGLVVGAGVFIFLKARSNSAQATKEANAPDESVMKTAAYQSGTPVTHPSTGQVYTPPATEGFPLNVGMTGDNVKQMQQALMNQFQVKLQYGADGNFGAKTLAALKSIGYSAPVSQSDYNNILAGLYPNIADVVNSSTSTSGGTMTAAQQAAANSLVGLFVPNA
jgi:hypothetical protein